MIVSSLKRPCFKDEGSVFGDSSLKRGCFKDEGSIFHGLSLKWADFKDDALIIHWSSGCGCLCAPCLGTMSSGVLQIDGWRLRAGFASGRRSVHL